MFTVHRRITEEVAVTILAIAPFAYWHMLVTNFVNVSQQEYIMLLGITSFTV